MKKRIKYLLSVLLALCLTLPAIPGAAATVSAAAGQEVASAVFGTAIMSNIKFRPEGTGTEPATRAVGGKICWYLDSDGSKGIWGTSGQIQDLSAIAPSQPVEVTVEYYDGDIGGPSGGKFNIAYNMSAESDVVRLENSGEWRTHTFVLNGFVPRALFGWGSHDFRLALWAPQMGSSQTGVNISSVKVNPQGGGVIAEVGFGGASTSNLSLLTENRGAVPTAAITGGKPCWELAVDGSGIWSVIGQIQDYSLVADDGAVDVTVEYYDGDTDGPAGGKFNVAYNAGDESEVVSLENSGVWKSHTFTLKGFVPRALFGWGSHDFRVAIWAPKMGKSSAGVYISSIKVNRAVAVPPVVTVTVNSSKTGNIFTTADAAPVLQARVRNNGPAEAYFDVAYTITDAFGGRVGGGTAGVGAAKGAEGVLDIPLYAECTGYYEVSLSVGSGGSSADRTVCYSVVNPAFSAGEGDVRFGACTHFNYPGQDSGVLVPLAKLAGFNMIRDEMYWNMAETTPGVVNVLPQWDAYVDRQKEQGMEPLLLLSYGNPLYDYDPSYPQGVPPYSDEAIAAFANYARVLAEHFKGKVHYYEVLNEWDYTENKTFNPKAYPPEAYAKVLAAAYDAVKSVDPSATVVGGVTYFADTAWLRRMLDAGGYNKLDALSFHFYTFDKADISPEEARFTQDIDSVAALLDEFAQKNGDPDGKELWITETGYMTQQGDRSNEQAAYAVRGYILGLAGGVDRIFYYEFMDEANDPGGGIGLLHNVGDHDNPLAGKQAFVAMNVLTNKIAGFDTLERVALDGNLYVYKAVRGDECIYILWNSEGASNVTLSLEGGFAASDIYGKPIDPVMDGNLAALSVAQTPVYLQGRGLGLTLVYNDTALEDLNISSRPVVDKDGNWLFDVSLTNQRNVALAGELSVSDDSGVLRGSLSAGFALDAKETKDFFFELGEQPADKDFFNVNIRTELTNGNTQSASRKTNLLAAGKCAAPPDIDGILSPGEWDNAALAVVGRADQYDSVTVPPTPWRGLADLSGTAYIKCDDDFLYFAAEVRDDTQTQLYTGDDIWKGDSLQIAIDPARSEKIGSWGFDEMAFALDKDNQVTERLYRSYYGGPPAGALDAGTAIIRDDENGVTVYEMAIPWTTLIPPGTPVDGDTLIGLSFLFNDSDGGDRHAFMQYQGGIGRGGKNPQLFGDLVLLSPAAGEPDLSGLTALLAEAESKYADRGNYAKAGVDALWQAMQAGYEAVANGGPTDADVTKAADALQTALNGLVPAKLDCMVKSMLAKVAKPLAIPYTWDGAGAVAFTTSNAAVCNVTPDGKLVPLKAGIAVITLTAPTGEKAVFAVTVTA